ncbi:carcinoembryonic antigen-related cell adhesion molecule 1-like isoform X2 [Chelonia mydas]|uniref:carcinoembryonic antigen-related cell adhesion molecule 1-like isoform X2 n=1 Tax=Chelonia mydas TaxID=8469 RepID=UPI001CA9641B|nr:carcinoembryonic antigen-related cell adhesion molecule 1-like isoform X2 [Chelonia mydas]
MGRIPHRPGGPWTGILLAASVLGSCLQPAPAQTPVSIVLTPPSPAVGGGVSLAPQNPPQDFLSCSWYRSATTDETSRILTYFPGPSTDQTGPAHTGRETAGPGCALHIAGLTLNVTGSYAVKIEPRTSAVTITVHLPVSVAPRPGLSAGAVAGIVIGLLAGAALVGVGAYFLYSRCRNETPKETGAPVLVYENLPPTAGVGPVAQPGSPPDPSPTYQTLQPRQQDVYEELKK